MEEPRNEPEQSQIETERELPSNGNAQLDRANRCDALRERLWQGRQTNYEQQDKAILTLSSAALALSMSFLKDIVPLPEASLITFLIVSWLLFAAAIVATVLSYLMSQRAHDQQIQNLENYQNGADDALDDRFNPFREYTERLNRIALYCFVCGLLATMCFVSINTIKLTAMSDKRVVDVPNKKGINPPPLPKPQNRPSSPPQSPSQPTPTKESSDSGNRI